MTNLTDYFQRIYIINLPSRMDRKREIQAQLVRIGLSLDHPQIELFAAIRPEYAGEFPNIGSRGCFLSHLSVLKDAQKRGFERILIFEDDLDFCSGFLTQISGILEAIAYVKWGFFYGGYKLFAPITVMHTAQLAIYPPECRIVTSHFTGFNQPVIAMLTDYLEKMLNRSRGDPEGGPMHVDGAYSWFRAKHPEILTYLAVPEIGFQRSSRTDIHDLRWDDRWPIVRMFSAGLRKIKRYE